jgi:soluble lytic murein transglycosylase
VAAVPATFGAAANSKLQQQREIFKAVFDTVERGDWTAVEALSASEQQLLRNYVLWPDLRAAWLRRHLDSVATTEMESFLQQFGALRSVRDLRYQYALNFVDAGNLPAFLRIYEQFYQGQNITRLDCLALQAEIEEQRYERVNHRAVDLWLVGHSQVKECDPVFKYLADSTLLGESEYRKRYALAIANKNFSLARWLGRKIDSAHVDTAAAWQQAQANPEDFLRANRRADSNETLREQMAYAAERLTYRNPDIAHRLWSGVSKNHPFTDAQLLKTAEHIALWTARDKLPEARARLIALPGASSDEVKRWRARTSLREGRWIDVLADIDNMDQAEKSKDEWRYWRAAALRRLGQLDAAAVQLELLSQERSYYGFLAADELGTGYALDHAGLLADEAKLARLETQSEIIRARELFLVGQDSRGRSEWGLAIGLLSDDDKLQAAILADRWGWHSQAIATAASLGEYDDLSIRYPLPYQETFESFSEQASIPPTWAYGIARSESLFMRDVRSHAGAVGLMQLMPATGREVARKIKLPYSGLTTLVDPVSNIRLGTTYLAQMAERFDGNQVLATAAYNAGPHRVDGWLPASGTVDARIWIENIPFNETRKYVKRVLAAQTIFHWRLTGDIRRLSDELPLVLPSKTLRVASR